MTKSQFDDSHPDFEALRQFSLDLLTSVQLLRWVGAGLLLLALANLVDTLFPPSFMNPVWEFQTIGRLVDQAPLPLIGLAFIFYGHQYLRSRWELSVLKFLSWVTLGLGVLFFLLIPLGVVNTVRIDAQNNVLINTDANQRIAKIQQIRQQIKEITTEAQVQSLVARLNQQQFALKIDAEQGVAAIQTQLLSLMKDREMNVKQQAKDNRIKLQRVLLKNSVRFNSGALIAGCLFVSVWRASVWVRRRQRPR